MRKTRTILRLRVAFILFLFLMSGVSLLAVPPLSTAPLAFQITNLLSSDRTGPWTIDYDDPGLPTSDGNCFTFHGGAKYVPGYMYHDYAYRLFGADASTTSSCYAENISVLDGTAGITSEFVNFELIGFNKLNTLDANAPWNILGQAGDHRVYANGQVIIKLDGEIKLTIINTQIHVYTPYPTAAHIRALNPVLLAGWQQNIGSGGEVTAWGYGTVDMTNSDATWAAEVGDPVNHQVKYTLSDISYNLQFPPSTARYSYKVELTPVTAPVNVVSFTPAQAVDYEPVGTDIKVNFSSLVPGGPGVNLSRVSVTCIFGPANKAFAYANKYWQLSTTLSSFTATLTFDVAGETLGDQVNWRIFHRVNSSVPWVEWTGGTTIIDATHIRADNVTSFSDWTVGTLDDVTLPVEMQSFTAVVNAQDFVSLKWITGSESNLSGYNVYRSQQDAFASASYINEGLITPTNTSTTSSYSYLDREVELNSSYYYWLESVEMNGESNLFGPVFVTVQGNISPELPQTSAMGSAYPNPFRSSGTTNVEVTLKESETGTVTIYNILGQTVKTYPVSQGIQTIQWNGRNNEGKLCGTGLYFYKLSTPSLNKTGKMIITK
ncbi:MAG: hypothetical protein CVU48_06115 [Candidatus Cloacimonetes bacterium HGW-Cloacimonetes-1]|jgi:hypothetical protein|nr:MAG: hypothetical protein CVU48_06115 [Candidatus Cloacimonetes bacterium HGW-Cloacimonetes-1]